MIATREVRTSLPSTIVPVRSLMITRAARSGSTVRLSSAAIKSARPVAYSAGVGTLTKPALSACALTNRLLMASAMRVVKSGARSCRRATVFGETEGAARSQSRRSAIARRWDDSPSTPPRRGPRGIHQSPQAPAQRHKPVHSNTVLMKAPRRQQGIAHVTGCFARITAARCGRSSSASAWFTRPARLSRAPRSSMPRSTPGLTIRAT